MKNFLETIEQNPELKAKIEKLDKDAASTPQDFIEAAAEYGVELTEADFQKGDSTGEISDEELEAVAGGNKCTCVMGGGGSIGTRKKTNKTCACVLGGGGEYSNGDSRCVCIVYGEGEADRSYWVP